MKKLFIVLISILFFTSVSFGGPTYTGGGGTADDTAYDEGTWNDNTDAATKNAIRDKIETLGASAMGAWGASSEITISAGGVAALTGQGYFTIDTNADGATDDLTQVTGLDTGDEIIIAPDNDGRTVVVKNGANLILCNGADFTMNNTKDRMVLQDIGADVLVELLRSSGGD